MSECYFPAQSTVETLPPMVNVMEDGEGDRCGLLEGLWPGIDEPISAKHWRSQRVLKAWS